MHQSQTFRRNTGERNGKKKKQKLMLLLLFFFKELQDAIITVKKKEKKTAFPKVHCASLQLNAKLDVKIPHGYDLLCLVGLEQINRSVICIQSAR